MITVKVSDLKSKIDELLKDGIEYVDLFILEADPDYEIPKTLSFNAYNGEGGGVDYEEVEHTEVDVFYKFNSLS